jgi:hypothetical protein
MSSCRELVSGESMQGRPEKSVCRGFSACRAARIYRMRGAVKRPLEIGDARANGGVDGSWTAYRGPQLAERRGRKGRCRERRVGMSRGGDGRIPKSNCKERGHAAPSFLYLCTATPLPRSRPPCTLAVAPAGGAGSVAATRVPRAGRRARACLRRSPATEAPFGLILDVIPDGRVQCLVVGY